MIAIDTSEYMRNGDYSPTRFEAQRDAVNIVANAKTEANPESTVALMKMSAGCAGAVVAPRAAGVCRAVVARVPCACARASARACARACLGVRTGVSVRARVRARAHAQRDVCAAAAAESWARSAALRCRR